MDRLGHISGVVVAVMLAAFAMPATAEVLDAVYRGTLVCDKLPFTEAKMREAISVTVTRGDVRYTHVVRLRGPAEAVPEQGGGQLNGQGIALQGTWQGGGRLYSASYSGTFVRRSAKLKGTQTWTDGSRQIVRNCSGVVKRPFKVFLPRTKKSVPN